MARYKHTFIHALSLLTQDINTHSLDFIIFGH